jgi:hypothetical protein
MAVLEAEIAADPMSRSWELYYRVRPQIETPENIGKLILFDLVSGDYEIANDNLGFDAADLIRERHPAADVFALRIGYEAVDVIGGVLERLDNP